MHVFFAYLNKDAAGLREQIVGDCQPIAEIRQVRVYSQLPGIAECLDLLRLAGGVFGFAVFDVSFTSADLRRKEEIKTARVELVKTALQKHQHELFEELDSLKASLGLPPEEFAPLSWQRGKNSVFETLQGGQEHSAEIKQKDEASDNPRRKLLREHLKNSRLFTVIAQRNRAYNAHMEERKELQRSIILLLQQNRKYRVTDTADDVPYICSYTTGDPLYREVLHHAFHADNKSDYKEDFSIDSPKAVLLDTDIIFWLKLPARSPGIRHIYSMS